MASLTSRRRNAQIHHLIANSGRRCLRHAAAVLSSVSARFSANCSVVGLEEEQQYYLQERKKNAGGPSSSSGDDNSQCFPEPATCLDYFYSDVASGSSERRPLPLWPPVPSWMSASIMDDNSIPSISPPIELSLSSSSGKSGLQQAAEVEICGRLHVKQILRVRMWQSPREVQMGHSYHQHGGGGGDDESGKITIDGRNAPPRLSQVHGSRSLFFSSWGSRQYMQSSRAFETYQGRPRVEELSRVRIWHNPRRFHKGHSDHHHGGGGQDQSGKASERILGWGLWSDIGLAISKGGAGYVSGSTALIADAAHSVSDIALSGVALWTSKVAHAPKDKQHPYGHGKFESIGALGISGMLLLTGGGIAWHALESLQPFIPMMSEWVQTTTGHSHDHVHGGGHHHGIDLQHPYVALAAAVVSIGVKEILYQRTKAIGEAEHSELLKASAWHHRSDAVSSVVALLGIGGAILGMPLLDPVAGFVVAGMIMKAGFETGYQSSSKIKDQIRSGLSMVVEPSVPPQPKPFSSVIRKKSLRHLSGHSLQDLADSGVQESVLSPIRNTVFQVEGVEGCHHLRGRKMGSFIHVDAHIEVDPWLSVSAAHNIAEAVRHQVHRSHPEVTETFVHIEPADGGTKTLTHQEAEIEHELQDHNGESQTHPDKNEHSFNKKDLTKLGSKSDLMKGSHNEACVDDGIEIDTRQHSGIEQDVRNVVGANFHEKMSISQVTSHFVQGKVVVEVEVSMNPEISVRIAMDYADDAQRAILERVSDISAVRVQLKLSNSTSQNL